MDYGKTGFVGRSEEIKLLDQLYRSSEAKICVIYGRRIGKSFLIRHWGSEKNLIYAEGIEGQSTEFQIRAFKEQFSLQTKNAALMKLDYHDWWGFLEEVTNHLKNESLKKKVVLVLDELQWMAASQTKLISLLKYFWDNHWSQFNVFLILCGSVATYMVKKVIRSKALYGRISSQLLLKEMNPTEAGLILNRRGNLEKLKYLVLLGGIPKYLKEIDQTKSFSKNVQNLCFKRTGFFFDEIDKIFYSQFRKAQTYRRMIHSISEKPKSLTEICRAIHLKPSGGVKEYLSNLELAGFIRSYFPVNQKGAKFKKYRLNDEFIGFYYKFIHPSKTLIEEADSENIFQLRVEKKWNPWLGLAFERFCIKHAAFISRRLGFADEVVAFGPYFSREKEVAYQVDLVFERVNNIFTIVEIQNYDKPVGLDIVKEFELKVQKLKFPRSSTIERMLIAPKGIDEHLEKLHYFHYVFTVDDFFDPRGKS